MKRESSAAFPTSRLGDQLIRRPESEELDALFADLAPFASLDGISFPSNAQGNVDPAVIVVGNRELSFNIHALKPLIGKSEDFIPKLRERVPGITRPISEIATIGNDWERPATRAGRHQLSLLFGQKTVEHLQDEQDEVREAIDEMVAEESHSSEPLAWSPLPLEPRLLIMMLSGSIKAVVAERIHSHIQKRGPFEVTLLPVGESA